MWRGMPTRGRSCTPILKKEGIAAKLFRKYPALLKSSADLHQAIMQEQLVPHRAPETEWERQMLRTEVKHYIDTSGLAYSYNEFYTQNMPDKGCMGNAAKRFVCKSAANQRRNVCRRTFP